MYGQHPSRKMSAAVSHGSFICALYKDPVPPKQIQDLLPKVRLPQLICSTKSLGPKVFFLF